MSLSSESLTKSELEALLDAHRALGNAMENLIVAERVLRLNDLSLDNESMLPSMIASTATARTEIEAFLRVSL